MNDNGTMLNAYPDSVGGRLSDMVEFLKLPELKEVFSSFYILPSVFHSDLDRGFSVIDYGLNEMVAEKKDMKELKHLGIDLKLDFILNHLSVLSEPFQDIIRNGEKSIYRDFFIDWNKFWDGCGELTEEGYIRPRPEYTANMFFRKPGLPILLVRMPDGKNIPYWNTFYQEVRYPVVDAQDLMKEMKIQYTAADRLAELVNTSLAEGKKPFEISFGIFSEYREKTVTYLETHRKYLGQMDVNIKSPLVWEYYEETIRKLKEYGAEIVRLDAFAYAPKEPGERNFLNDPGTWELLERLKGLADKYGVSILPEIHASYEEGIYKKVARKGYMTYDFFLPGLIIDAMERKSGDALMRWAQELTEQKFRVVNMLGCHDGIPLLDLKGMIPEERIQSIIDVIVKRGGFVKDLHGQKNMYYQVNATYYSALGEDDRKMLLARALQIFMPGKPQVWYLDLFAGKNDHEAVVRAGAGGHKEINRTNLSMEQIKERLLIDIVQKQIQMLHFRNTFEAFGFEGKLTVKSEGPQMLFEWKKNGSSAILKVNFVTYHFEMRGTDREGRIIFSL